MDNKLLIIESPNKIKTISKYLDKDFSIVATVGHIRDLSSFGMGFDKETFDPKWIIPKPKGIRNETSKKDIIDEIKKKASKSNEIYLATDPDREGEAIAWHVYEILDDKDKKKCKRITFNEITKQAIIDSFQYKRDINLTWVQSQFARRILDRLIGFKLSKLLQIKLKAESAGRVQSVALKFIEDREKEIEKFVSENWWTIDTLLLDNNPLTLKSINSDLNIKVSEKSFSTGVNFLNDLDAKKVVDSLGENFVVKNISDPSFYNISPKQVYKTSTLQQDAINKLNWSSKKITSVAQRLYEGIEVDGNQIALISYPRTDSVRLSDTFIKSGEEYITNNFGKQYLSPFNFKKSDSKKDSETNVQDAHEGIRPIDPTQTPDSLKNKIGKDEFLLYELVWKRTIASLMANAKFKKITILLENNKNEFSTFSRICEFDGYRKIYDTSLDDEKEDDKLIDFSKYQLDSIHKAKEIKVNKHETSPPPRYTQASLIADLEKAGVGRPSTYSSMANIAIDRGYANLDKRFFVMTDIGKVVIAALEKYFSNIVNKDFTKYMEEHLDKIAQGEEEWKSYLKEFSPEFEKYLNVAYESMEKVDDEKVNRLCPLCNSELVIKRAKKGGRKFIGCSNFPNCKYIEPLEKPQILEDKCPECNSNLLMRKNKRQQNFVGCSNYPNCHYLLSEKQYKEIISKPNYKLPTTKELAAMKVTKPLSTYSKEEKKS